MVIEENFIEQCFYTCYNTMSIYPYNNQNQQILLQLC